jgi:large exoprotein involved in heme utilization and adhesion
MGYATKAIAVGKGSGQGGNLTIQADRLTLRNQASLTAETASTQGGNMTLNVQDLLFLRNNSLISTTAGTAQAGGNGGNMTINIPKGFVIGVLSETSDIRANAFLGNGGKVNITAIAIFGLKFQPKNTPFSDITASSQLGISGTVTLTTLNVDLNRGLATLPIAFVDPSNKISPACGSGSSANRKNNRFVVLGSGGIPANPDESFGGSSALVDLVETVSQPSSQGRSFQPLETQISKPDHPAVPNSLIVEAQGWAIDPNGTATLLAQTNLPSRHLSWHTPANCQNVEEHCCIKEGLRAGEAW